MDFRALNIEVNIQPFYSCKKYTSHHTSQRKCIIVSFFPFSSCFVFFLFHVMFSLPEGYLSLSHTQSTYPLIRMLIASFGGLFLSIKLQVDQASTRDMSRACVNSWSAVVFIETSRSKHLKRACKETPKKQPKRCETAHPYVTFQ